jgi:predicted Zn-dependent protease
MKRAVLVTLVLLATALPAFAQLGSLLDKAGKAAQAGKKVTDLKITDDEERQIGAAVSEKVRQQYGVVQDAAVHRYVSLVGMVVAQASTRPDLEWRFIVLDTDGVNAFAAPGGFIHITRGALALLTSEMELAGVLAHEVVHVTEKHTITAIRNNRMKDLGLEVAPSGGLTKAALNRLAEEAYSMVYAGYGRGEELESDRLGLVLANRVGYDPRGLGSFLTRLQERNKSAIEKQGLFASHPEMRERLEKLDRQIADQKLTASAVLADRYKKFIDYTPTPQTEIAQVAEGTAGLAGAAKAGEKKTTEQDAPKKKRGFGLANLVRPGGEEKKSAQVTGSGGSRGVDTERNAKGGGNPALVAVALTRADLDRFKQEGQLR